MRARNAKLSRPAVGALRGLTAAVLLMGLAAQAGAQVMASDETAGYLVFPKIIVQDSSGSGTIGKDTLVQLTNTARVGTGPVLVHCWYVNANSQCNATGPVCETNEDCASLQPGTLCVQGWAPNNFDIELTPENPVGWSAHDGRNFAGGGPTDPTGNVPGVLELPFRGELKCLQQDGPDGPPSARNDLKGEATIITVQAPPMGGTPPRMTSATYNAIGFQADTTAVGSDDPDDPLCLGSLPPGAPAGTMCAMQYAPCPNVLIMNHFFEGAHTPLDPNGVVQTNLTLVPCSEDLGARFDDFRIDAPPIVTAQMLVYNEFEQRFSTSARVQCYRSTNLADIDTRLGAADDAFSIFAVGVQGTVVGQTRIRGVRGFDAPNGYGLIGVGCESYSTTLGAPADAMTAFNLHADVGFRAEGDAVYGVNGPPGP
jgi:hypothetical protein